MRSTNVRSAASQVDRLEPAVRVRAASGVVARSGAVEHRQRFPALRAGHAEIHRIVGRRRQARSASPSRRWMLRLQPVEQKPQTDAVVASRLRALRAPGPGRTAPARAAVPRVSGPSRSNERQQRRRRRRLEQLRFISESLPASAAPRRPRRTDTAPAARRPGRRTNSRPGGDDEFDAARCPRDRRRIVASRSAGINDAAERCRARTGRASGSTGRGSSAVPSAAAASSRRESKWRKIAASQASLTPSDSDQQSAQSVGPHAAISPSWHRRGRITASDQNAQPQSRRRPASTASARIARPYARRLQHSRCVKT